MASETSPESDLELGRDSISADANIWGRQFVRAFESALIDSTHDLSAEADVSEYHAATVQAMLETLRDSGMDADAMMEATGQFLIDQRTGTSEWNAELNQRRFELIDKEIQDMLTLGEQIELAGLTRIMREAVDSEINLPMAGAKALHRKLLELGQTEEPG